MGYKYPYKRRIRKPVITKELREKHKIGLTLSPLDLCLRRGLINQDMHRAANHFIFLHNARYNIFNLRWQIARCYEDYMLKGSKYTASEEELKRVQREYLEVVSLLKDLKAYELMLDVCIYDVYPMFLKVLSGMSEEHYNEFNLFKAALYDMNALMIDMMQRACVG